LCAGSAVFPPDTRATGEIAANVRRVPCRSPRNAELIFEFLNRPRQRGLAHVAAFRGTAEIERVTDGEEY
jgi:hypothetical protein